MSYIPDLAAVSYSHLEGSIRAVGWLESSHDFTRGSVAPEFSRRLMALVKRPIRLLFSLGMHWCSLCAAEGRCGPDCRSSQAVLLVPATNWVYETPIWIGHYVLGHSYQPPAEFCQAVMSCPKPGSDAFRQALLVHLPSLANYKVGPSSLARWAFFGRWSARRTLQLDPQYGSWKWFQDQIAHKAKLSPSQQSPSQQDQKDLQFYENLGLEDSEHPCKKDGCGRGAIRNSVFCRSHHFEQVEHRECPFDH